jgi:hypothetical protein
MNDSDLDHLLDSWKAPAAPQSMRKGLRGRLPRSEWHVLPRPLIWLLVALLGSVVLAMSMTQARDTHSGILLEIVNRARGAWFEYFVQPREAERAARIVAKIRQSKPKVYLNGKLAGALEYSADSMTVHVPDGVYSLTLYPYIGQENADGQATGQSEAGHIHGKLIEFQAGSQRVRIECDEALVERDRGVFIRRLQ